MAKFIMAEYKDNLLGEANSFLEVLEQVSRLAPLDKPVLVIGERGTGKELIANRLHFLFPLAGAVYLPELRGAE
jgi:psp operon transcriptional activator